MMERDREDMQTQGRSKKEDIKQSASKSHISEAQRKADKRKAAAEMKDRYTPEEQEAVLSRQAEGEQVFFHITFPEPAFPHGEVYVPPELLEGNGRPKE
jgi:hypothetical protein